MNRRILAAILFSATLFPFSFALIQTAFIDPTATHASTCTNPNNAWTSNNIRTSSNHLQYGQYDAFGFTIPDRAVIKGIEVRVEWNTNGASYVFKTKAQLVDASVLVGDTNQTANLGSTTERVDTLGSSGNKWNYGWTPQKINDPNFGVRIDANRQSGTTTGRAQWDNADIRISYAMTPDVNIIYPENKELFRKLDNPTTDINLSMQDSDTSALGILVDLNYSSSRAQGTGTQILKDANLSTVFRCDSNTLTIPRVCRYGWNISGIPDGNYYILAFVRDSDSNEFDAGDNNFAISSPAKIFFNQPLNDSNTNTNLVRFDVNDSGGLVQQSSIRVDLNGAVSLVFNPIANCMPSGNNYVCSYNETGLTGTGDWNITVYANNTIGDGNRATSIFHYDVDKPLIKIIQPLFDSNTNSRLIVFDVNDSGTGVRDVNVDLNGAKSTTFSFLSSCVKSSSDRNIHCSYIEVLPTSGDYNITVFAVDYAGNNADRNTTIFHYDSNKPTIRILQPLNDSNTTSRLVEFDVNDLGTGVQNIKVDLNSGVLSTSFSFPSSCIRNGKSYHCSYLENLGTSGDYNISIDANDFVLNGADRNQSVFHYDVNKPTIALIQPLDGSTASSTLIIFDVNDLGTGIWDVNVDFNSIPSTAFDFAAHCTKDASGKNLHCEYDESFGPPGDYNLAVYAVDFMGNNSDVNFASFIYANFVYWNHPTSSIPLYLGTTYLGGPLLSGDRNISSVGATLDVNVFCIDGNCSLIYTSWNPTTDMAGGQELEATFYCSNNYNGYFWADFNLTSLGSSSDTLRVDCNVNDIQWENFVPPVLSAYEGETDPSAEKNIYSIGANTDINVYCAGGDCAVIYTSWDGTTDMAPGETLAASFYCDTTVQGSYSADFNLFSLEDLNETTLTVDCVITDSVIDWNQSSLDFGAVDQNSAQSRDANIISTGVNNNIYISCSGDCNEITDDWVDGGSLGGVQAVVNFDCNTETIGVYSADFNVYSDQDDGNSIISVSCTVVYPVYLLDLAITGFSSPSSCDEQDVGDTLQVSAIVKNNSAGTITDRAIYLSASAQGYSCTASSVIASLSPSQEAVIPFDECPAIPSEGVYDVNVYSPQDDNSLNNNRGEILHVGWHNSNWERRLALDYNSDSVDRNNLLAASSFDLPDTADKGSIRVFAYGRNPDGSDFNRQVSYYLSSFNDSTKAGTIVFEIPFAKAGYSAKAYLYYNTGTSMSSPSFDDEPRGWHDYNYDYRLPVRVQNNSTGAMLEYPFRFYINTSYLISQGKLASDCNSVRFYGQGNERLVHYLDDNSSCNDTNTLYWVKIPRIDSLDSNIFYFYYSSSPKQSDSNELGVFSYTSAKPVAQVMSNRFSDDTLAVVSHINDNNVWNGVSSLSLNRNSLGTFAAGRTGATTIYSKGPIGTGWNLASGEGGDTTTPMGYAGKRFAYRNYRGTIINLSFYAPFSDANIVIKSGVPPTQRQNFILAKGSQSEATPAIAVGNAVLIDSNVPILAHFYAENGAEDPFPMYPVSTDWWGVGSATIQLAAIDNDTNLTIYYSDRAAVAKNYNAGQNESIIGLGTQGTAPAVHIVSDTPMGIHQANDSDGGSATAFLPENELEKEYFFPLEVEYAAISAAKPDTNCVFYDSSNNYVTSAVSGSNARPQPNKIIFSFTSRPTGGLMPPSRMTCNKPVYAYYEFDTSSGESNIFGPKANRQQVWPEPTYAVLYEQVQPKTTFECGTGTLAITKPSFDKASYGRTWTVQASGSLYYNYLSRNYPQREKYLDLNILFTPDLNVHYAVLQTDSSGNYSDTYNIPSDANSGIYIAYSNASFMDYNLSDSANRITDAGIATSAVKDSNTFYVAEVLLVGGAFLDLGLGFLSESEPSAGRDLNSIGLNTDVNVSCTSGDCGTIYTTWANKNMSHNEISPAVFYCKTSALGSFSATFSLTSDEDSVPSNLVVNCTISKGLRIKVSIKGKEYWGASEPSALRTPDVNILVIHSFLDGMELRSITSTDDGNNFSEPTTFFYDKRGYLPSPALESANGRAWLLYSLMGGIFFGNNSDGFSDLLQVDSNITGSRNPSTSFMEDSNSFMLFTESDNSGIFYQFSTGQPELYKLRWSSPVFLAQGYHPSSDANRGNSEIWLSYTTPTGEIVYTRYAKGSGWSSTYSINSGIYGQKTSLFISDSNNVYIAYEKDANIFYVKSSDSGSTWSAETNITTGKNPSLVEFNNHDIGVFYNDKGQLYYGVFN